MVVAEDEDLVVVPDFVERGHEVVRVFGHFLDGGQLFADVVVDEALQILADELVDYDLLLGGGLGVRGEVGDMDE